MHCVECLKEMGVIHIQEATYIYDGKSLCFEHALDVMKDKNEIDLNE